jgi:hypothetical protein
MEFLLLVLLFLAGWLVCWIQMSKSESRKYQYLKFRFEQEQSENQQYLSEIQQMGSQLKSQEHLLESLFLEVKKGTLTFPEKPELAQFESQQWQSGYPEAKHPDSTEVMGR